MVMYGEVPWCNGMVEWSGVPWRKGKVECGVVTV